MSDLGKYCELEGFKKVISRIHKFRFRLDPKLLYKLEFERIKILIQK